MQRIFLVILSSSSHFNFFLVPVKYFNHLYIHIINRNMFHVCFHHITCSGVLILQKSKLTWSPETGALWKGHFVSLFSRQCPRCWKSNVLVIAPDFNCCWLLNLYTYIIFECWMSFFENGNQTNSCLQLVLNWLVFTSVC